MSSEPSIEDDQMRSSAPTVQASVRRTRLITALPWLWLVLSAPWAAVIVVTDHLAWPLALWIATTVGPLTALRSRLGPRSVPQRTSR